MNEFPYLNPKKIQLEKEKVALEKENAALCKQRPEKINKPLSALLSQLFKIS
jgi:hypothetical protein